jgi:hypothetical protein
MADLFFLLPSPSPSPAPFSSPAFLVLPITPRSFTRLSQPHTFSQSQPELWRTPRQPERHF